MTNEALNMDCMDYMRKCSDKQFNLAIVDPPYGIGESGAKNRTRDHLAKAKDYHPIFGNLKIGLLTVEKRNLTNGTRRHLKNILYSFLEYQKIK